MKNLYNLLTQCARRTLFLPKTPLLLALFLLGMNGTAWGAATLYGKTAVGSGKGTAKVEVRSKYGVSLDDNSTTGSSLVTASTNTVTLVSWAYCKFTATPSTGYSFDAWYTDSGCSKGRNTANSLETDSYISRKGSRTDTYYAKFTPHTYTIKFDANNENASGNTSEMSCTYDEDAKSLSANGFSLVGYTFSGWNTKDDGTGTSYTDKQNVNNLTTDDNVDVILYAQWTPNTYTITFNGNNNSSGRMTDQVFTYDVPQNLKSNAYARKYTVTYNANGGDCSKSSEDATFTFDGWSTVKDGDRVYTDAQANLKNLTAENGKKIELFARWKGGKITLPGATKEGKVFDGWYIGEATDPVGTKNSQYAPTDNVELVAHWADISSPRYSWNGETTYLVGAPSLDLDELWVSGNEETAKQFKLVSFTPAAGDHTGATRPALVGSTLSLGQAGTIKVAVAQEAAEYFYPGADTLIITVNRHANTILVKGEENYRKAIEIDSYDSGFTFTATNTDYTNCPISIEQVEGLNIATYYPDQNAVSSARISGEAAWQVSQAETYYYEGATNVFYIDVRLAEEVTCYILENQSDEKGEKLGRTTHEHTWTEENVAGVVSFDVCYNSGIAFDQAYAVEQYLNGDWKNLTGKRTDISTSYQTKTFKLNPAAKGVRFWASGSVQDKFKNVSVTRYTYLNLSEESFTFDKTNDNKPIYNNVEVSKTFTINYSMPQNGTQINISSTHPAFKVSPSTISETACKSGTNTITVTYSSDDAGTHEGKIVVNNEVFYKEIAVIGTTIKKDQTITWTQGQSVKTTDNLTLNASSDSKLQVKYSVLEGATVATVTEDGVVTIIKDGDVTFRTIQAGNKYYNPDTLDRTFHISKVRPTIQTAPSASAVLLPNTLESSSLTGGEYSVAGTFAWRDKTTAVTRNNNGYDVIFTPENNNWYINDTIVIEVGIQKYVPTITTNELTCSAISYGQTLASSNISGTLVITDIIPQPNETVEGTITWNDASIVPEVGATALVVFTPNDDTWFLPVEIELPITVTPASAKTYAATATISEGQSLSEVEFINGTIGLYDEVIAGEIQWGNTVDQTLVPDVNTYTFPIKFESSDANYTDGTGLCTVTVEPATVWDGLQPLDPTERVITSSDIEVEGNITLGGLTINVGDTVTIKSGATLTIGNINSLNRSIYGDLVIEAGGKLILNGGEVHLNEFTLQSTFESEKPMSGQVINQNKIIMHGDAYFVLDLDPSGEASPGWYDFTVPFPVDELNGITRLGDNGEWQTIVNERNYAVMDFHEELFAQGKSGWKKYTGVLQPGRGYTMTIDCEINTYRFKMAENGVFNSSMTQALQASAGGVDNHLGWNSVGNGTMSYVSFENAPSEYVQLYDHAERKYVPVRCTDKTFVVGASYFIQAEDGATIDMEISDVTSDLLRAPQRVQNDDICRVDLSLTYAGKVADYMFITCRDDAQPTYTIGKDVAKMGETSEASTARIWSNAKGANLCAVDVAYNDNQAIIPLNIKAPKAGEYAIALDSNPAEEVYLRQDGIIVWNMAMGEYYAYLTAGTDSSYDLLVIRHRAPNTATGIDAIDGDNDNNGTIFVEKMIVNGQLYILRDGTLYDAQGKKVTNFNN